nr:hypothetical protein [uncultured Celeribacter sp.]
MALAFDQGDQFAHSKDAGTACHHLSGFSCSIHDDLARRGYSGCAAFDCQGAGQRVTALFRDTGRQDWRSAPPRRAAMMHAFRRMRDVQELRQMLHAAAGLKLSEDKNTERHAWIERLVAATLDLNALDSIDISAARLWLRGLARFVSR